jgi:Pectate lyase superfamily protein
MATNLALASIKSTGSTASRTFGERFNDIVNVKDFGAKGDNITDDAAAIQAAITYAMDLGVDEEQGRGATVFFPAGQYLIGTTLIFNQAMHLGQLHLCGASKSATSLFATGTAANGFIINKDASQPWGAVQRISNMSFFGGWGCVLIGTINDLLLENCAFNGYHGLVSQGDIFSGTAINCTSSGSGAQDNPGGVGFFGPGMTYINCTAMGHDIGFAMSSYPSGFHAGRCEMSRVGILCGQGPVAADGLTLEPKNAIASMTWSAGIVTVTTSAPHSMGVGSYPNYVYIVDTVPKLYRRFTIVSEVTSTTVFKYELISNPGTVTTLGSFRQHRDTAHPLAACIISGFQTERCETALMLGNVSSALFAGMTLTGERGPSQWPITSITWSSAGGGTATVTTQVPHLLETGRVITIEDNVTGNSPWLSEDYRQVTVTGDSTFTFPITPNPGASNGNETWSPRVKYGIYFLNGTMTGCKFSNIEINAQMERAGIDLSQGNIWFSSFDNITVGGQDSIKSGYSIDGWIHPSGISRGQYTINGKRVPSRVNELPGAFNRGHLPENEQYFVIDAPSNTPGAIFFAGGGAFHTWVRSDPILIAITAISASGTTVSVTTAAPHGLSMGQKFSIEQVNDVFNGPPGEFIDFSPDTIPNTTNFTYTDARSPTGVPTLGQCHRVPDYNHTTQQNITAISGDGTTVSVTTQAAHGLVVGNRVAIRNVSAAYNGTFTITLVGSTTTFQYADGAMHTSVLGYVRRQQFVVI